MAFFSFISFKFCCDVDGDGDGCVVLFSIPDKAGILLKNFENIQIKGEDIKNAFGGFLEKYLTTHLIKDKEEAVGNQTRVKVVKNKVAPPFKMVEFDIMYGEGISRSGELVDLGVKAGLIEKAGSWFAYENNKIGQVRENAKDYLKNHPDIANKIEQAIRSKETDFALEQALEKTTEPDGIE